MGAPGAETVREDDGVTSIIRSVVATIVAGQGVDPRPELEQLGIGFVVLRSADTAAQLTASRMDAVPGLVAVGQTDVGWLWRITPLNQPVLQPADVAHRARIVDGKGAAVSLLPSGYDDVDTAVPAGAEGRLVVLAERADPGWSAWLDGRKLTSTTSGWAQAFTLPPTAGQLTIRYDNPWSVWSAIGQITVIGLTVMLAIPMPARRPIPAFRGTKAPCVRNTKMHESTPNEPGTDAVQAAPPPPMPPKRETTRNLSRNTGQPPGGSLPPVSWSGSCPLWRFLRPRADW